MNKTYTMKLRDKMQTIIEIYGFYCFSVWLIGCIFLFQFCASKYEVVQQLDSNVYHLQGLKDKDVYIIETEKPLKSGQVIKYKDFKNEVVR